MMQFLHKTILTTLAAALLCVLCLSVESAMAREVSVTWQPDLEDSTIRTKADALKSGFSQAIFDEAVALLPGTLSEARAALLREQLDARASGAVVGYSELGIESIQDEQGQSIKTLKLDVNVNRSALKKLLKRLGVYYTVNEQQPFTLELVGDSYDAWDQLGQLQELTGVRVRSGASPVMTLSKEEGGVWSARMSHDGREWSELGKDLSKVWVNAWAGFFTRPEAGASMVSGVSLVISGWYAPDGPKAFQQVLSSWEQELDSAVLAHVDMLPDGLVATWRVKTLDREALSRKLDAYLAPRGLRYNFEVLP
ncbi:hypothetical protein LWC08_03315 [Desulfobaculum bizertense]|uniref:hypothetical protein n=1 Tax=Desulfobaculum bizertense TaxID=376490 RepID=UPI001F35C8A7|nr:hypothetical protein [Desulfobaculum bizertense]UIJ38613.1 hypothetical protein LWC08_03315 [Desulfobaculum bizertense]